MTFVINIPMWLIYITVGIGGLILLILAVIGLFTLISFWNWRIF